MAVITSEIKSPSHETEHKDYKRIRDASLDFKYIPAGKGIYSIHSYPAMFHPWLVRKLINEYSKEDEYILDPFLGSGVAAVESITANRKFIGFDINPLAILITKVRTTLIDKSVFLDEFKNIELNYKKIQSDDYQFKNINFWFSPKRIDAISRIIKCINLITNENIMNFFKIALSETIRAVSRTNPNEFKLVRRKKYCYLPTFFVFKSKVMKNIEALSNYYSNNKIYYQPVIKQLNIYNENLPIKEEKISLIITSPPYGDSQTTVAYGQYSRLSLQWLGLPWIINKKSLGAKRIPITDEVPSLSLYETLNKIITKDVKRTEHVYAFYYELYQCMIKLVRKIKKHGYIIFVVGNRTVKNVQLPTDLICTEIFTSLGCIHKKTLVRQIGNKRMPIRNSPTNIAGITGNTMSYEYIIICEKVI